MKNKKMIIAVIAVVLVIAALGSIFVMTRPETFAGKKTITVTVVHKDGSTKEFTCKTTEEYLGPVLLEEKIVEGEQSTYGLMIYAADGETADWNVDNGWWQLFEGDVPAITGADAIVITDGGVYRLEYTIG